MLPVTSHSSRCSISSWLLTVVICLYIQTVAASLPCRDSDITQAYTCYNAEALQNSDPMHFIMHNYAYCAQCISMSEAGKYA